MVNLCRNKIFEEKMDWNKERNVQYIENEQLMIIEKKIEKRRITEKLFKKKGSNVSGQIKP